MRLAWIVFALTVMAMNDASAQKAFSPEVGADRRVTFRLRAPNAQSVKVRCESLPEAAMVKGNEGVWSFTTEALDPDIYTYSFSVDGLRTIDLANPLLKFNLLSSDSQVHVPGPESLPWEIKDVPRGQIHHHFYKSGIASEERDFYVYTPPGYDPAARKKYPVLYLLHGFSDDASAWTSVGLAHVILDNLIARKAARPMLIVMPLGYGTMEVVRGGWGGLSRRDLWQENMTKFQEILLSELMPQVEKNYRTANSPKDRAIAGLSMGGSESLMIGLNALDRFAWIGAFSSGGLRTDFDKVFPKLNPAATAQLKLLWISCGREDGLFNANQQFVDWLKSVNIKHSWNPGPGAHNFRYWRRNLAELAPLIFTESR
jgi:enterochelin esterase family protein